MKTSHFYRSLLMVAAFAFLFGVTGCGLPRNQVPLGRILDAKVVGMPAIRFWEIGYRPDVKIGLDESSDCSFLALSGGGANGAFGAGFLNGWSESGTRPTFRIVTGISTGSLIAPLAFLGPEYDQKLKKYYTTLRTKDLLDVEGILGFGILPLLIGESYASTKPMQKLIAKLIDQEILDEVAAEYAKGRRLYVGTTNLDAQRFMVWDMGAIASSGNRDSLKLFRKVMLASASIPGGFPPVYFDVEVDGKKYDEMHVDGGVVTEVFGYGPVLFKGQSGKRAKSGVCSIYVIRNGKLASEKQQMPRRVIPIVARSFGTLMKAHSWGDLYRLYAMAKDDGVDYNYVSIPDDFVAKGKEMFDPVEMKRLFDLGYEMAESGYQWQKDIPGFGKKPVNEWIWTPSK